MPDITTPFIGTDGATRANFNLKIADMNAHGNDLNNPHAVTALQVGLGNTNNTTDAAKPVSTAQQIALNLKANLASPTFTGNVTAPTFVGSLTGNISGNSNYANTSGSSNYANSAGSAPANGGISSNTTSIAGALTVSNAEPSSVLPAGTLWAVV